MKESEWWNGNQINLISIEENGPIKCYWKLWFRSNLIKGPINKIILSWLWKDQGWGDTSGEIDLKLCYGIPDNQIREENSKDGSGKLSHVIHRQIIAKVNHDYEEFHKEISLPSKFIKLFKNGC